MSRRSRTESAAALDSVDTTAETTSAVAETPAPVAETAETTPFADFSPPAAADIPVDQLCPSPLNPRRAIDGDGLEPLEDSIVANGILQPLLVRPASGAANDAWMAA